MIFQFTNDGFVKIVLDVDLRCLKNGVDGKQRDAFATAVTFIYLRIMQPMRLWQAKRVGDKKNFALLSKNTFKFRLAVQELMNRRALFPRLYWKQVKGDESGT